MSAISMGYLLVVMIKFFSTKSTPVRAHYSSTVSVILKAVFPTILLKESESSPKWKVQRLLSETDKQNLKQMIEEHSLIRVNNDRDRGFYMQLIYERMIDAFGVVTERGLAFGVVQCGASFSKYINRNQHLKPHFERILENCSSDKQIDNSALVYFTKKINHL